MALRIADAAAMQRLGAALAAAARPGARLYLSGDLGAGKTTLVRGFLQGRGYRGTVKSPTYTLVESYPLAGALVHHFDLYRLAGADELELIGARDYFDASAICLVEWPEHGAPLLPRADLTLTIQLAGRARRVHLHPASGTGHALLARLQRLPEWSGAPG